MIKINDDNIPNLPHQMVIDDICVCIGVFEQGVVVHYIENDVAFLIEWKDIVMFGHSVIEEPKQRKEIPPPKHRSKT